MYKLIVYPLAAFVGALAGAIMFSSPSHADNSTYLQELINRGMTVYNVPVMVAQGHEVCRQLNNTTGDVVVNTYLQGFIGYDSDESYSILVSAVDQLCPWHDHRGEAASVPTQKLPPRTAPKGTPISGGVGGRFQ